MNNLFIQQLVEKLIASDQEVHLVFIDFLKAYDTLPHSKTEGLFNIISKLFKNIKTYLKAGNNCLNPLIKDKTKVHLCFLSYSTTTRDSIAGMEKKMRTHGYDKP